MPQLRRACLGISYQRGGTLIMTLVFVTMFTIIFASLTGLVSRTFHESVLQAQDELAFQMAESGLNYARWRLAHDSENYTPETRELADQYAGALGTYDITLEAPVDGESIIEITSIGATTTHPEREVTLKARYGRPSLARYSSIINDDVWFDGEINGASHANGGIRMEGSSDSLMTSAKLTYACQPYHGCSSPWETKPGVWGDGVKQELWEFPAPPVDYNAIAADLLTIQAAAEASDTAYTPSNKHGYQIEFHDNNTYSIYEVTALTSKIWSASCEPACVWKRMSHDVQTKTLVETKAVPSNGVIFVEDQLWINGDIRDRVTVAAGRFPDTPASNIDIIPNGNISYDGVTDGTRSFAAIAQRHILIPWSGAPDVMQLDGAFVAQKGSFQRRYYPTWGGADAHRLKTSLTQYGMMASNGVPVTAWVDEGGTVVTGFQGGSSSYDPNLLYSAPPYFPSGGEYEFISWEEEQ